MQANYTAKKSGWKAITVFRILFCWLIIPLIVMIVDLIKLKSQSIEFYDNYIIQKSGILAKHERKSAFMGVISVSINQTLKGRLFGYGNVSVDVVGKWDIDTRYITRPDKLKRYLESRMIDPAQYQRTSMYVA